MLSVVQHMSVELLAKNAEFSTNWQTSRRDLDLASTLSQITNVKRDEKSWSRASLPVRFGGLGLRPGADPEIYFGGGQVEQDFFFK